MTKRKRRSLILTELTKLSRDGWTNALPCDYEPLESELETIENWRAEAADKLARRTAAKKGD